MTAQIKIDLESHKNVLLLPLSALGDEVSPQVYEVEVLNGEKVEKRQVKINSRNDVQVEVVEGLKEGEQVVTGRITES